MSVDLTISKTLGGAAVADTLAGAGTGVDLGAVVNGEYCPITLKSANTGWQPLYIKHNAAVDPITSVKTFIAEFSQTYGGAATASADFTALKAMGAASGNSANNADGLSSGLRVEHDADLGGTLGLSAFNGTRAQVKKYGAGALGQDLATGFDLHVDALLWNNAGTAVDATTPVTGKIGKAGDTVLGDTALVKLRLYLETAAADGGMLQWDWVVSYSFTA
jgi:hypothetical protein